MRALLFLALLPLAGCGSLNPFARSGPPDTPEQAECRRIGRDAPAVREIQQTLSIGNNDRIIARAGGGGAGARPTAPACASGGCPGLAGSSCCRRRARICALRQKPALRC